jgi:hypothetical protein
MAPEVNNSQTLEEPQEESSDALRSLESKSGESQDATVPFVLPNTEITTDIKSLPLKKEEMLQSYLVSPCKIMQTSPSRVLDDGESKLPKPVKPAAKKSKKQESAESGAVQKVKKPRKRVVKPPIDVVPLESAKSHPIGPSNTVGNMMIASTATTSSSTAHPVGISISNPAVATAQLDPFTQLSTNPLKNSFPNHNSSFGFMNPNINAANNKLNYQSNQVLFNSSLNNHNVTQLNSMMMDPSNQSLATIGIESNNQHSNLMNSNLSNQFHTNMGVNSSKHQSPCRNLNASNQHHSSMNVNSGQLPMNMNSMLNNTAMFVGKTYQPSSQYAHAPVNSNWSMDLMTSPNRISPELQAGSILQELQIDALTPPSWHFNDVSQQSFLSQQTLNSHPAHESQQGEYGEFDFNNSLGPKRRFSESGVGSDYEFSWLQDQQQQESSSRQYSTPVVSQNIPLVSVQNGQNMNDYSYSPQDRLSPHKKQNNYQSFSTNDLLNIRSFPPTHQENPISVPRQYTTGIGGMVSDFHYPYQQQKQQ